MQSEKGRVTRNSMNEKELLTFKHMQSEKWRVTRNSMNEKELLTFIHMQSEKGRVTRNSRMRRSYSPSYTCRVKRAG